MLDLIRRHRERRVWERRVKPQVDELLLAGEASIELQLAGLPRQREGLLSLYRGFLEPAGYHVRELVETEDIWLARFERNGASRT